MASTAILGISAMDWKYSIGYVALLFETDYDTVMNMTSLEKDSECPEEYHL